MTDIHWEELAGTLFEEAGDALLLFEPNTEQVVEANPMAQRLSGFARRELLEMKVTYLVRSNEEGGLERLRTAFRRTGMFHSQEGFWLRQKPGTWVHVNLTVTRLHTQRDTLGLITARDISERRESLARVQAAEAELRRVLTSVADCLWSAEINEQGQWVYRYLSPVVERITGQPEAFFLAGPEQWLAVAHEEDRPRLEVLFARMRAGQSCHEEFRIVRPGGAVRWVRNRVVARLGAQGGCRLDGVLADITQRKQAEQALRKSEARYRLLIEQLPAIVWTTDADLRVTSSVGGGLAGIHEKPHEAEGRLLTDMLGTSDPTYLPLAAHLRALQGETVHYEMDWKGRSWHTHIEPLRYGESKPIGVIGLTLDITERVKTETALRQSEARHRLLVQQLPAVIWTTDAELNFTSRAGAGLASLGIQPGQFEQQSVFDLFGTRDPEFLPIAAHRRALAGEAVTYDLEWGGRAWHCNVEPLNDAKQQIIGVIGLALDISERLKSEEALRASEARYRTLIENLTHCVFLKDRELRFVAVNEPFCRGLGRSRDAILGKNDLDFYPQPLAEKYRGDDRRVMREKQRLELEEQNLQGGRWRTVQTVKTPVLDPHGEVIGVLGIFWDVTEQRNLEAQLRQSHKMEAVGKLAGGIAHDFNNLLTGILGNLALALSDLPVNHPSRELLANAEVAGQRAAELTRQLLGFSRRTPLQPQHLGLNAAIDETVRLLRRTFDPRVEVTIHASTDLWPVEADAGQINQVLMNLCLNARDAMPEGGRLTLETANVHLDEAQASRFTGGRPGDFVCLRVQDSGHGIPPAILDRIFEPFFTTKEPGKGTGLGLAMVFGIVQQHQGWVDCLSQVGKGTCFEVYLPRLAASTPAPEALPDDGVRGGHETILLVDDEAVVGRLGQTILERYGYRVLLAADGQQALETYRRHQADIALVVLDLAMPRLSGPDTLRALRQLKPDVAVLISSGYSSDEDLRSVEREGVLGFVAKPYRPADLARRVRAALDVSAAVPESR